MWHQTFLLPLSVTKAFVDNGVVWFTWISISREFSDYIFYMNVLITKYKQEPTAKNGINGHRVQNW